MKLSMDATVLPPLVVVDRPAPSRHEERRERERERERVVLT
jgi:hypothetical protein